MVKNPNVFQIGIKIPTKERLEKLMHPGQTWDGVINEALNNLEKFTNPSLVKSTLPDQINKEG